ncbi:PEP-CTERM sorting domain-containing protein [Rhizomicrobium electricum]|nr:PEP-CTERM sorting domain-containing protein [Rhizomicrobium electricum]NIJ47162.1 hypothetical protein [Rhizomicrobium electricum]
MLRFSTLAAVAFSAAALFAGPASATMIVAASGGGTGINAISAACSAPTGAPGASIFGCLNTDHSAGVSFSTTDGQIDFGAGGQAKIIPAAGNGPGFTNLTIGLVGHTFSTLIFNIEAQSDGMVSFASNLGDVSVPFALDGAGNNFFTISGDNFTWISFTTSGLGTYGHGRDTFTDGNIVDVKQVRFDGLDQGGSNNPPPDVPEPATLLLLCAGLAGIGAARRRKG